MITPFLSQIDNDKESNKNITSEEKTLSPEKARRLEGILFEKLSHFNNYRNYPTLIIVIISP